MKKLIVLLSFLLASTANAAEVFLVMQWNETTRIVLQDKQCLVKGLTGLRAVVQRHDGAYIKGCWKYVDNRKNVRIDWDNPNAPGDFAVLEMNKFKIVEE